MDRQVIKPLLSTGVQYVGEVLKCGLVGVVCSGAVLLGLVAMLPPRPALLLLALVGCVIFIGLYGVAGHQRGIFRVLSRLVGAHGGLLFDQTLGRFIQMTESRRPGTVAKMLSVPGQLAAGFRQFLGHEGSGIPKPLRRLSTYYVNKVGQSLTESGTLPTNVVVNGQLHEGALKAWAVQQMREQFEPSWTLFLLLACTQVMLAAALWYCTR